MSATSVSRRVGEDEYGVVVGVAVCGGVRAIGTGQEVGESDEGLWKERDASEDAGDVGATLDPL